MFLFHTYTLIQLASASKGRCILKITSLIFEIYLTKLECHCRHGSLFQTSLSTPL